MCLKTNDRFESQGGRTKNSNRSAIVRHIVLVTLMADQTICLFRHGETVWNTENRRQGHSDSPLTEKGRRQALANARRLRRYQSLDQGVAVFASPLGRARQTALIIVEELGLSAEAIVYEPQLMESSFGIWEGLTDDEIKVRFPDEWQARTTDKWSVPAPSGESYADVQARVSDWYNGASLADTSIVVCHGLTSRVFRGIYAGLSHKQVFDLPEPHEGYFELRNGSVRYIK